VCDYIIFLKEDWLGDKSAQRDRIFSSKTQST
jgi:hypothetical protein